VTPGTNVANNDLSSERDVIPTVGCRVRREDEALDDHSRRVPRAHDIAIEQPYDDQDMPSEPRTIALVSCVSSKEPHAAPARDLYTSPLFRKARAYAERNANAWYILSAKYGLVDPDSVIEPYDVTLNRMGVAQRRAWAAKVRLELEQVVRTGDTVVMLAGAHYREGLMGPLRARGVRVEVPMQGLGIGKQLQWLSQSRERGQSRASELDRRPRIRVTQRAPAPAVTAIPAMAPVRHAPAGDSMLDDLYALVYQMAERYGAPPLGTCSAAMRWPERGVYFFLDPSERRANDDAQFRIVRVGTHSLKLGSWSTLWGRLRQHRGQASGMGNHRGSVFRRHVGQALLARDGVRHPTWGVRPAASREVIEAEREMEERVSAYLARLLVTHVAVLDEPGPASLRGYVERNAIALLSSMGREVDVPSAEWLGQFAKSEAIRRSGLWNVRHVGEGVEEGFLGRLGELVGGRSGSSPI